MQMLHCGLSLARERRHVGRPPDAGTARRLYTGLRWTLALDAGKKRPHR